MIDRMTLRLLLLLVAAMTAAALWRISQLPDWQLPFEGLKGPYTRPALVLFVPPLSILLTMGLVWASKWIVSGPVEAMAPYKRLNRNVLIGVGILTVLGQAYVISRSLGFDFDQSGDVMGRGTIIVTALLVMIHGNSLPKMPWLSSRFSAYQLDPWQHARSRRFSGWMSIVFGLAMIVIALLMPLRTIAPIVMGLSLAYVVAIHLNIMRLKREPTPIGLETGGNSIT